MTIVSISLSLGIPFMLLYSRKKGWNSHKFKQTLFFGMSIIGLLGFILARTNSLRFLFYAILTTPVFLLVDYGFKYLSIKEHNRDFYLWLRFSDEIDDSFSGIGKNKHVKTTDIIFSISLLILIAGMGVFGAVLFGQDALYNRLTNY